MTKKLDQARAALRHAQQKWHSEQKTSLPRFSLGIDEITPYISSSQADYASLHEIYMHVGHGGSSLCAALLTQITSSQKNRNIFWISPFSNDNGARLYPLSLPPAIQNNLILITPRTERDVLWSFEECLKSGEANTVIAEVPWLDLTASRRLQLACEKGNSLGLALCHSSLGLTQNSAARTRWRICGTQDRHWALSLIGGSGVRPGNWTVTYDQTTLSLSLVPSSRNGSSSPERAIA
jgi:protein ImuA